MKLEAVHLYQLKLPLEVPYKGKRPVMTALTGATFAGLAC